MIIYSGIKEKYQVHCQNQRRFSKAISSESWENSQNFKQYKEKQTKNQYNN